MVASPFLECLLRLSLNSGQGTLAAVPGVCQEKRKKSFLHSWHAKK